MMHQPVLVETPRFSIPWQTVLYCFDHLPRFDKQISMSQFDYVTFRPYELQLKLANYAKLVPEAVAPDVPTSWSTSGYANLTCCVDHCRYVALQLKGLGVDVTDVPAIAPGRLQHFPRPYLEQLATHFPEFAPAINQYLQHSTLVVIQ